MNAQDYISSGLLEAYVLGGLSLPESEQVAGAVCRFPDVAGEVVRLESDLFRAAEKDAVAPPAGLENKIWAAIQSSVATNKRVGIGSSLSAINEKHAPKVIPFEGSQGRKAGASWLQAAVLVTLLGSVAMNLMLWNGRSEDKQAVASLQHQVGKMSRSQQQLTASLDRYRHEADMMAQPGMMPVPMLSTQPGHPMAATIYWDKAKKEAYVSVQKLPPPPPGMQYQLWVIANGKPVDIGMLDNEVAMSGGMQKVPKAVTNGQAFAVSLEKAGGSQAPTADKIYLMGKMPV